MRWLGQGGWAKLRKISSCNRSENHQEQIRRVWLWAGGLGCKLDRQKEEAIDMGAIEEKEAVRAIL